MRGKMEPLTEKITAAQQLVYAYKDKEKTIGNTRRNVKEKINTFVLELINQLNQTKEKLHREIDTSADKALLDCSKRRHIVEQSLTNMTQCKDYVEHSLSQLGTSYDEVVLKSLKQMNNRMSVVTGELNTEDFNVASDGSFRLDFVKSSVKFDNIGRLASSSDIKKDPPLRFPTLYNQDVLSTEYKVKEIDQKQVVIKAGVVKFPLKLIPPSILSPFVPVALLSCQMRVAESGEEIKTVVASADDLNTYNVECYPTRNGLHNLKVKIQHRILNEVTLRVPINPSLKHTRPTSIFSDLRSPYSVAVADNNLVLVADCGMNTIAVLKDGTRYTTLGRNIGTGNAKFENPRGVAVSKDNFVLVTDNHRLQKVNWDGKLMASVGNHGNGNLEFSTPCGMAVSPVSGKIYIVESSNHRVQVLNDDLTFSFMFGSSGTGNGQFLRPRDITMDTQGNLYVSDAGNNRIQKFTSQGRFVCQIGRAGTCPGQLSRPHGVAVDSSNFLYVAEVANHRVSIFKTSGDFFGCFGEEGSDNYQFKGSGGIDFSKDGQLFICDFYNKRVVAY
jgi:tripartite motif-containing protein 2/3/tripartite motif-containing protein 71